MNVEELWQKAIEKAIAEATHYSEIEIRAKIYYRAMVLGVDLEPKEKEA